MVSRLHFSNRRTRETLRRSMPFLTVFLALACLLPGACILYTAPVNSKPTVSIAEPTAPIVRGKTTTLYAQANDPEGGNVTLSWSTSTGPCDPPIDERTIPPAMFVSPPGKPTFPLPIPAGDQTPICVYVVATDPEGATSFAWRTISSSNQPPVAVLTVLEPTTRTRSGKFELYSVFHLSAAMSHDPDGDTLQPFTFELESFPPEFPLPHVPGLPPGFIECPDSTPNPSVVCLDVGAHAGLYKVKLTANDGTTMAWTDQPSLEVDDDHPPCVKETDPPVITSPLVLDPTAAKTFTVIQILDDGSPLPTPSSGANARPTFQWTLRRNGGAATPVVGYDAQSAITLPGNTYTSGDVVEVSVAISDGVAVHPQPLCDLGCPAGCPQAATWTVMYR
jgi:hypothetical protein